MTAFSTRFHLSDVKTRDDFRCCLLCVFAVVVSFYETVGASSMCNSLRAYCSYTADNVQCGGSNSEHVLP